MSIAYVTHTDAAAATVTLPSYSSGDLAIVWAFRDGSTTVPTDDANYTTIVSSGANTCSLKIAARKLTSGDPNPSFTNATEIGVVILRADAGEFAGAVATLFGANVVAGASSTQPSYGTLANLIKSHSFIVGMGGHRSATDMNSPAGPGGMTKRAPTTNTLALHTLADAIAFTGGNFGATVNASSGWRTYAVEVLGNRTQLFPQSGGASMVGRDGADNPVNSLGGSNQWRSKALATTRGAAATTYVSDSVAGPTSGIVSQTASGAHTGIEWLSPPLAAAVTLSAPIETNARVFRSSASANMGPQVWVDRIDGAGVVQESVISSEQGTENTSAEAASNWLSTIATPVAFAKGDRIRVRFGYNDAGGTAASGFTESLVVAGTAAGATGDTYVILGEAVSFIAEPAGTVIYPTTTASDIAASLEAWTSRGSGVTSIGVTASAGSRVAATDVWYTRRLTAMTLSGGIRVHQRAKASTPGGDVAVVEIAVVDSDGSNPVVWGIGATDEAALTASEADYSLLVSGPDTAIADGQRIRIRFLAGQNSSTSDTVTAYYAGTSGGASGDTSLTFTQTLNEAVYATPGVVALTLTTYAPTVTASAGNVTATPDTAALTTATFAPTVSVSDNKTVTPDVAALTTTTFAPVIKLGIVPDTASLTLTTFAPTVSASDNKSVTPDTASMTTATFAPTISVSDNKLVVPDLATLTLTTYAPTVSLSDNILVTPDVVALNLSTFAPTVTAPDNQLVTPDVAALALTTFAPVVTAGGDVTVTPGVLALTLTTYAPTVTATGTGHAFVQAIIIV